MLVCFFCNELKNSYRELKKHVKSYHDETSDENILKCKQEGCNRIFSTLNSIYKHIRVKHINRDSSINVLNLSPIRHCENNILITDSEEDKGNVLSEESNQCKKVESNDIINPEIHLINLLQKKHILQPKI